MISFSTDLFWLVFTLYIFPHSHCISFSIPIFPFIQMHLCFNLISLIISLSLISFWYSQFSSVTQSCPTLWYPMNYSTPGLTVHHQLQESTQTHVHWVSDAIQWSHPLLSPSSAFNLSQYQGLFKHQGLFKWVSSSLIRWPKYCSFSFNISPSNEHPGLICFRMDWLDLLLGQGTVKCLLQNHS